MGNVLGWLAYGLMAFCGLVLIVAAVADEINKWRWQRAWKRGEIKPPEKRRAEYLAATRMGTNR